MSIYAPQNRYSYPEACYALNLNRYEMKMHQHHRCEIMYVADGSCQVFLEKEQITLHSKQLIFFGCRRMASALDSAEYLLHDV